MFVTTFSAWFLIPENGLIFIKIINLVLFLFKLKVSDNSGKPTFSSIRSFKLFCKLYINAITPTQHENITLPETWGRKGWLLQNFADTHHRSAKKRKKPTSIQGQKPPAKTSPDAPLTLPLT